MSRHAWSQDAIAGIARAKPEEGTIAEVSVTFLGGQSDRPSVGGVFHLLDAAGVPAGRVVLPTMQVARK